MGVRRRSACRSCGAAAVSQAAAANRAGVRSRPFFAVRNRRAWLAAPSFSHCRAVAGMPVCHRRGPCVRAWAVSACFARAVVSGPRFSVDSVGLAQGFSVDAQRFLRSLFTVVFEKYRRYLAARVMRGGSTAQQAAGLFAVACHESFARKSAFLPRMCAQNAVAPGGSHRGKKSGRDVQDGGVLLAVPCVVIVLG